ncbi:MAG: hypothetical protein NVSMB5_05280 [Candidatus Velthaea sp.]
MMAAQSAQNSDRTAIVSRSTADCELTVTIQNTVGARVLRTTPQLHVRLPEEAIEQLRTAVASYQWLKTAAPACPGADIEMKRLDDRLKNKAELWWTDVAQAELCLVELLDIDEVRARLTSWRRRLHEVAGDSRFTLYMASAADLRGTDIAPLRSDLAECIRAVFYFYGAYGMAARSRQTVTLMTCRTALIIVLFESVLAVFLHSAWMKQWGIFSAQSILQLTYLLATSAAGVVGSVVSVQRRLEDPCIDTDPYYRYIQTNDDRVSIAFVSPLFGAILGMLIYGLLASGMVSGSAIPAINAGALALDKLAQVLLYGFIAGFAERLVPDALNRIATRTLGTVVPAASGATATSTVVTHRAEFHEHHDTNQHTTEILSATGKKA